MIFDEVCSDTTFDVLRFTVFLLPALHPTYSVRLSFFILFIPGIANNTVPFLSFRVFLFQFDFFFRMALNGPSDSRFIVS